MSLNYENVGKNVIYNRSVDNIEDYVKGTIVGCYIGEGEEYYVTSIESSGECIKVYDDSLIEIIEGDSITPQGIVNATSQMTAQQAADMLDNIGGEPKKFVITVTYDDVNDEYTADKTFAEIVAAYQAGKTLVVDKDGNYAYLSENDNTMFIFVRTYIDDDEAPVLKIAAEKFYVEDSDVWVVDNNIISAPAPTAVTDLSSTSITLEAAANTVYNYGTLTSLTISNPPATGAYSIVFTSGSTATTTTIPATILGLESFAPEANTVYEINVLNNRAVVGSWAVSV